MRLSDGYQQVWRSKSKVSTFFISNPFGGGDDSFFREARGVGLSGGGMTVTFLRLSAPT